MDNPTSQICNLLLGFGMESKKENWLKWQMEISSLLSNEFELDMGSQLPIEYSLV